MDPNSFTSIKRHVGGTAQNPAALYLISHEGTIWASNRYWVAPVSRVAPLLDRFNLPADKPGAFEVNGTVKRANGDNYGNPVIPDLGRHIDPALYPVALVPSLVAGHQVYTRYDSRALDYRAVYQTADGAFLALLGDDLEWLSSTYSLPTPEDHYYGPVRLMAAEPGDGNRAVAIVADLIHRITPVTYGTGENGEQERRGGETENLGPRVVGIITSLKLTS